MEPEANLLVRNPRRETNRKPLDYDLSWLSTRSEHSQGLHITRESNLESDLWDNYDCVGALSFLCDGFCEGFSSTDCNGSGTWEDGG